MTRNFAKPAKTFEEQVQLLQLRGMIVDDVKEAIFYLQHLNYYRLSAYWLDFELDHATHQFKPDTNFKDVLKLYIFDRELRLLVLDGIERIEVSVRSQWAYYLAHRHSLAPSHSLAAGCPIGAILAQTAPDSQPYRSNLD